ncbi:MAG: transposase [Clostridia bacterium]|nr:transposase [Clostridia bacterium]
MLTPIGEIVCEWLGHLSEYAADCVVDQYTVMPNHIHLLLRIRYNEAAESKSLSAIIGWLKYQITKSVRKKNDLTHFPLFQRSFYDHIVRNQEDYERIAKYMYENPVMWQEDRFYLHE